MSDTDKIYLSPEDGLAFADLNFLTTRAIEGVRHSKLILEAYELRFNKFLGELPNKYRISTDKVIDKINRDDKGFFITVKDKEKK